MLDETLVHVGGEDFGYCPRCGAPLIVRLIETEDRPRLVCDRGHILYVNPKLVAGVIPERRGRVLLLRRAIEPRHGSQRHGASAWLRTVGAACCCPTERSSSTWSGTPALRAACR